MSKYDKTQIPPEPSFQGCLDKAFHESFTGKKVFEPEFEQRWEKVLKIMPNWNNPHHKGSFYHGWKLKQRASIIENLAKTVPQDTFYLAEDGITLGDDTEIIVDCECGNQSVFRDITGDLMCLSCGRVYRLRLSASASDYLVKGD